MEDEGEEVTHQPGGDSDLPKKHTCLWHLWGEPMSTVLCNGSQEMGEACSLPPPPTSHLMAVTQSQNGRNKHQDRGSERTCIWGQLPVIVTKLLKQKQQQRNKSTR